MSITMLVAYALAVALVLAAGAWLMERALTGLRLPTRFVWIGALGLSVGLPLAAFVSGLRRDPAVATTPAQTVVLIGQTEVEEGASMASCTGVASSPGSPCGASGFNLDEVLEPLAALRAGLNRALATGAALLPAGDRVDPWIAGAWGAASILVAMVLLASMLRLRRRASEWPDETLLGRPVKVSPDTGPATVGPLGPLVVIPRWARQLPPHELELVLRHEGEHVRARDTLLLALGLGAVVGCPWNPLVWWQVRRLRDAVEVDCDRRVLRDGIAPARYGDLLLRLGSRGRLGSLAVPTIAGSTSLLERRLTAMKTMRGRVSIPKVLAATGAALLLVGVACTTEPPMPTDATPPTEGAGPAAADAPTSPQSTTEDVVSIWVDGDGTVQVNNVTRSLDRVAEAVAFYGPSTVVSLEAHQAAPYRVVSEVQDQLRAAGIQRVVFTTVGSETQRSPPRDVSTLVDDGLAVVLPEANVPGEPRRLLMPGVDLEVSVRNLLFLEVLPTGIVEARHGENPSRERIASQDVEAVVRLGLVANPNLIVVLRTHPDAEYRHMYDVLDGLQRAEATRFSLQVAE